MTSLHDELNCTPEDPCRECLEKLQAEAKTNPETFARAVVLDDPEKTQQGHPFWHEPNDEERECLYLLIEELNEAGRVFSQAQHIALKVLRFGFEEVYPETRTTNRARLEKELGDVLATIAQLIENEYIGTPEVETAVEEKFAKMKRFMRTRELLCCWVESRNARPIVQCERKVVDGERYCAPHLARMKALREISRQERTCNAAYRDFATGATRHCGRPASHEGEHGG